MKVMQRKETGERLDKRKGRNKDQSCSQGLPGTLMTFDPVLMVMMMTIMIICRIFWSILYVLGCILSIYMK